VAKATLPTCYKIVDLMSRAVMLTEQSTTRQMFGQEAPIVQARGIAVTPLRHSIDLPFRDQEFDCVVSFGVLEHVQSDLASLHEIRRVLKPGGIVYVTFLPYFLSWTQALARLAGSLS